MSVPVLRSSRHFLRHPATRSFYQPVKTRRLISTAPAWQRPRSWKNSALRLGLAAGAVYFYNTTDIFAEEWATPQAADTQDETAGLPTVDALLEKRKQRLAAYRENNATSPSVAVGEAPPAASDVIPQPGPGSPEELEEEADQQGAFNPETGEINWDCPCLGGMAHGPCGEVFKAAFSCFVYSKEEPKGVDCIDKFKGMQECFRLHPDVYGAEFDEDEEEPLEGEHPDTPPKLAEHSSDTPALSDTGSGSSKDPVEGKPLTPPISERTPYEGGSTTGSTAAQASQDERGRSESDNLASK